MRNRDLPLPLKEEEQMRYFMLYNETKDIKYRNFLVEHNLRLVGHVINERFRALDEEEIFSIGVETLIKSIDRYDFRKNVKFSDFVCPCIRNSILNYIEYSSRMKRNTTVISLEETAKSYRNDERLTYLDIIPDERAYIDVSSERKNLLLAINSFLSTLKDRERVMFEMFYGINGQTETVQQEIANMFGIKHQRVGYLNKTNLVKLRKYLISLGYSIDKQVVKESSRKYTLNH